MRTNLLRFMFDSAWRFDAAGNELYVGAGWLILIWTLAVCVLSGWIWWRERSLAEAVLTAGFWLLIPAGFLSLLLLQPDFGIVRDGCPVMDS
jgi:membrane protease YdiL (CAAX protease family)